MSMILPVLLPVTIKLNTKPGLVTDTDHFVVNMDINVLYPPLDISLDCFYFTKLSLTFPVCSPAPQVQFAPPPVQPQQQGQ